MATIRIERETIELNNGDEVDIRPGTKAYLSKKGTLSICSTDPRDIHLSKLGESDTLSFTLHGSREDAKAYVSGGKLKAVQTYGKLDR